MPAFIDLTNKIMGRWRVLRRVENNKHKHPQWLCRCFCKTEKVVSAKALHSGSSKSCGCLNIEQKRLICLKRNTTHGLSKSKIHIIWVNMLQRCNNPRANKYNLYGGIGIRVCESWHTFDNFLLDMGFPPSDKHSIERIDSLGTYNLENCRWAIQKEQQNNRKNNRRITCKGKTKNLQQWSEISGVHRKTISDRISNGWSVDDALFTRPVKGRNQYSTE